MCYDAGMNCKIKNCEKPVRAKKLCTRHYNKLRKYGDPLYERPKNKCSIKGCDKKYEGKGFCKKHYDLNRRRGNPMAEPLWGKGSYKNGYKLIFKPGYPGAYKSDGRILEHRYIMEQHLGRSLQPHERVHHRNGIRDDNRIENLELWSTSHPPGQRVADKIKWAKEFLKFYENEEQGR